MRRIVIFVILVTGLAGGVAVARRDVPTVAPPGVVSPADLPEALAVHYRAAESHAEVFAAVPCFCGCTEALGHRHLLDCFVREDGAWEAHGSGCGVCLGEAARVSELIAARTPVADISADIVATWGDPYTEQPS